ncbi:21219_t:CDS:2, partial [Entrophospora sp. SA101]
MTQEDLWHQGKLKQRTSTTENISPNSSPNENLSNERNVTDHFDEFSPESGSNQIDLTQGLDYDLKQLVLNIMNEVNNIYYDSQNGDNDLNYEDFEENNFERNNLEENDFGDLNPRNSEGENLDNILEQPKAKSKNRPKIIPKKNNLC